jgi:hypothetical protein
MKTGDIVFLRRPYKGYRAVELMERLECRWLVRIVESGLELEVYEDATGNFRHHYQLKMHLHADVWRLTI